MNAGSIWMLVVYESLFVVQSTPFVSTQSLHNNPLPSAFLIHTDDHQFLQQEDECRKMCWTNGYINGEQTRRGMDSTTTLSTPYLHGSLLPCLLSMVRHPIIIWYIIFTYLNRHTYHLIVSFLSSSYSILKVARVAGIESSVYWYLF